MPAIPETDAFYCQNIILGAYALDGNRPDYMNMFASLPHLLLMSIIYRSVRLPGTSFRMPVTYLLWMSLALVAVTAELLKTKSINNYLIFEGVFRHVTEQKNLYLTYPGEYEDHNHYGPVFSLIIAPFALLPRPAGVILWCLANAGFLLYALHRLPLSARQKQAATAIAAIEMMTSIHNEQFNPMLTALLILSWVWIREEKEHWATLCIALGFFIKIYGITGLTFFLFSRHKLRFIAWFALWSGICMVAPMLLSSPAYILQTYADWWMRLKQKNIDNSSIVTDNFTDISVTGMIRRIGGIAHLNLMGILAAATALFALPLFWYKRWREKGFQLCYLALVLLMIVLFSSGSESATYVIAFAGFAIWWVYAYKGQRWMIWLLVFCLLLTSLSSTDLFPRFIQKEYIRRYSLKAAPMLLVWLIILWRCLRGRTEISKSLLS